METLKLFLCFIFPLFEGEARSKKFSGLGVYSIPFMKFNFVPPLLHHKN